MGIALYLHILRNIRAAYRFFRVFLSFLSFFLNGIEVSIDNVRVKQLIEILVLQEIFFRR